MLFGMLNSPEAGKVLILGLLYAPIYAGFVLPVETFLVEPIGWVFSIF